MRITSLRFQEFKKFSDLIIKGIFPTVQLVVMIGPNGSGKSSLFEGMNYWVSARTNRIAFDKDYHWKVGFTAQDSWSELHNKLHIDSIQTPQTLEEWKKAFYFRTAYRHEANFKSSGISSLGDALDDRRRPQKLIDVETRVSDNYQRLVGDAINEVFNSLDDTRTVKDVREKLIGEVRSSMARVFDNLVLQGTGNPMNNGTFLFEKGVSHGYHYTNLSGREKAAFDLLLDFVVKREFFNNTIYCIDEPELHMHTRLQGQLLAELYRKVPDGCQLWVATNSIGMMRCAMELHQHDQCSVAFLDFEGHDFDQQVEIRPTMPGRDLWKRVFSVALDDLGELSTSRL